jgi:hypothetical protein
VGAGFLVEQQLDVTRVILSELRTVGGAFQVVGNPNLTYLSAPKLESVGFIFVCSNQLVSLPQMATGTWPAKNPAIMEPYGVCVFEAGAQCNSVFCTRFTWPN